MTEHRHQTAPTQFVEAAGIRFAYRRFGKSGGVPLVFNMHFTGRMDHWDPLVSNRWPRGVAVDDPVQQCGNRHQQRSSFDDGREDGGQRPALRHS